MHKVKRLPGGEDTAAGEILWLSPWPSDSSEPLNKIFNHPVMVISVDKRQRTACVLIISSLKGKKLADYGARSIRAVHLPIDPSPIHPDTGELLSLKSNLKLHKNSYIKTETRYWVSTSLIKFDYHDLKSGKRYQLRTESLAKVRKAVSSDIPIKDGMALKQMYFGALSSNYAEQALPRVPESVPNYGSTHQSILKLPYAAHPPSKPPSRAPLPSTMPRQYSVNFTTASVQRPANLIGQHARNEQRTALATSPLLPVYAQSRPHHSGRSSPLGRYILIVFASLLLAFFIYMAYWIHRVEDSG